MSERRGRRRAVTPGDILEVAKRHAVAHGWRASRVQAIAAEVGVSRPTLYSAFPSKQDLGIAIIRDVNTTLLDALALSIRDARTTEEGLRRGILFALTEADRNPLVAMILREDGGEGTLTAAASVGQDTIIPMAVRVAADLLAAGHPEATPERLGLAADTAVRMTFSHVLVPGDSSHEDLADRLAALCIGILETPVVGLRAAR